MIKKIFNTTIIMLMVLSGSTIFAQVAIGKTSITNSSVLLEFGSEAKGIIVPQVASAPNAAGGTFVFNSTDKALEVWEGKNNSSAGGWTNLTADTTTTPSSVGAEHSFTNTGTDVISASGAGVIIGASTTTKPGALVLESTVKALVLPLVANPHLTMKGAIAGTIVYDTEADMLAVYDGVKWSYWK
ncbi:MAG: hypothetical protein QM564_03785 [Bergeyella sp.]